MNQTLPFNGNSMQQEMMYEAGNMAQRGAMLAFILMLLTFLLAVVAAIWMYRDADARGKSGPAAGAIGFLSFFYGPISTVMISCAWILFRPALVRRSAVSEDSMPHNLPPEIQTGPTPDEFFRDLQDS